MSEPLSPERRPPFSLRGLLILTTLTAVALWLIIFVVPEDGPNTLIRRKDEQWFLGAVLGGALLGIAIASILRWRVVWLALLLGMIGAVASVWRLSIAWSAELTETLAFYGPERTAQLQRECHWAESAALILGMIVSLGVALLYQLLVWASDFSDRGLIACARRRPNRALICVALLAGLGMALYHAEFLCYPFAWRPRHVLPVEHDALFPRYPMSTREGWLSRRGDWFVLHTTKGSMTESWELYRLQPDPQIVGLTSDAPIASAEAANFDCEHDRLAIIAGKKLHIADLATQSIKTIREVEATYTHSLQWLPGGRILVSRLDHDLQPDGSIFFTFRDGEWTQEVSRQDLVYDARSDTLLEKEPLRFVDPSTRQVVVACSQKMVDEITRESGHITWLTLSPDRRYIMEYNCVYDHASQQLVWSREDHFGFYDFTASGHVIAISEQSGWGFLERVPLAHPLHHWLALKRLWLLDPATKRKVACTPLFPSIPTSVVLSHDGSRMAVLVNGGVHIYDVPEAFRK